MAYEFQYELMSWLCNARQELLKMSANLNLPNSGKSNSMVNPKCSIGQDVVGNNNVSLFRLKILGFLKRVKMEH